MEQPQPTESGTLVVYQTDDGALAIEARVPAETIWLPMAEIASLFGVKTPAISKHIKNIFAAGELSAEGTVSEMETVRQEGRRRTRRSLAYYNPDGFTMNLLAGVAA